MAVPRLHEDVEETAPYQPPYSRYLNDRLPADYLQITSEVLETPVHYLRITLGYVQCVVICNGLCKMTSKRQRRNARNHENSHLALGLQATIPSHLRGCVDLQPCCKPVPVVVSPARGLAIGNIIATPYLRGPQPLYHSSRPPMLYLTAQMRVFFLRPSLPPPDMGNNKSHL